MPGHGLVVTCALRASASTAADRALQVPMAPHAEVALQPAVMESAPVGRATGPTGAPGAAGAAGAGAWTGDVEVFDAYQTDT